MATQGMDHDMLVAAITELRDKTAVIRKDLEGQNVPSTDRLSDDLYWSHYWLDKALSQLRTPTPPQRKGAQAAG